MTEQEKRPSEAALPAEPEGRAEKAPRLEPPRGYAWLASMVTVALVVTAHFVARGNNALLRLAGVGSLILAAVFIFPPFVLLARYGGAQEGESYLQTRNLVDRGLYAIVRHPQYLGYILLAGGFALLSQHGVILLLAAIAITCFYFQAVQEERYCLAQLGEPYRCYLRRVPRFNFVLGIIRRLGWQGRDAAAD
jgi:protein-S-isoprenylcysteine O-methyltransferase Ste14